MTNTKLNAGFGRKIINPSKGILTIGYGNRLKGNRGIHDDLTATALVLEWEGKRVGIVSMDLLAIHEDLTQELEDLCGIPLLLCCTHTHSAPMTNAVSPLAFRVKRYRKYFKEQIFQAITDAATQLQPVELFWGVGEAKIAVNRRERQADGSVEIGENPEGPVDRRAAVLEARSEDGQILGRLVNMQCHATVMGPENLLVSADWVGAMRKQVEEQHGGLTLYIQGAAGDLNPRINVGKGFENVAEIGAKAARTISEIIDSEMKPLSVGKLNLQRKNQWIPLQSPADGKKPPKAYRSVARTVGMPPFLADFVLDFLYPWRTPLKNLAGNWAFPIQLNLLDLGEFKLATMGMEVFTEIGMEVRENLGVKGAMFASLTNSCYGYLPTRKEYEMGGYEIQSWQIYRMPGPLPPDADQMAINGILELDQSLSSTQ